MDEIISDIEISQLSKLAFFASFDNNANATIVAEMIKKGEVVFNNNMRNNKK